MKDKNIFQDKLYNHTMPVRDGLWEAIEAQLPPETKPKRFPVFWFTLFGTTLLGGALMIGMFNTTTQPTQPAPPLQETEESVAPARPSIADASQSNNAIEEGTSIDKATSADADESLTSANNSQNRSANSNTTPSTSKTKSTTNNNLKTPTLSTSSNVSAFSLIDQEEESDMAAGRSNIDISFLPMTMLEPTGTTLSQIGALQPDPNCYKFGAIGTQFALSLDVLGGPGFSTKSFENNGGESSAYADARKSTESYQYGWSIGARLNVHHRSGFTGRIGLNYTQVGDIFDYQDSSATQTTTRIDSFFAADGTFLYTETNQVLISGTLVKKIHNTYRYLDIPLIVGYELRSGLNAYMINVGPVFNLTTSQEGQILDSMLHPRSITPGEPGAISVYKTNVGVSLYLSAGMLFPLSDRLSALIEPSFLYRLNPVTLNSYTLKEHRHYASLNLGIRYHIN